MSDKSEHIINAIRYVDAVHNIQLNEKGSTAILLDQLTEIQQRFNDEVLKNYIHEYKLETSDSYQAEFEKQEGIDAELEEEENIQNAKAEKSAGVLYRGSPLNVTPVEEKEGADSDGEDQYMMYRGQKVKIKKDDSTKEKSDAAAVKMYRGKIVK